MGRASYRIVWVWDEHWMGWNRDCPAAICGTSLLISDLQHSPSGRGNWSVCDRKDTCSYALRPGTPNRWIENPPVSNRDNSFLFSPSLLDHEFRCRLGRDTLSGTHFFVARALILQFTRPMVCLCQKGTDFFHLTLAVGKGQNYFNKSSQIAA